MAKEPTTVSYLLIKLPFDGSHLLLADPDSQGLISGTQRVGLQEFASVIGALVCLALCTPKVLKPYSEWTEACSEEPRQSWTTTATSDVNQGAHIELICQMFHISSFNLRLPASKFQLAADGRSYVHFKCLSLHLSGTAFCLSSIKGCI